VKGEIHQKINYVGRTRLNHMEQLFRKDNGRKSKVGVYFGFKRNIRQMGEVS